MCGTFSKRFGVNFDNETSLKQNLQLDVFIEENTFFIMLKR